MLRILWQRWLLVAKKIGHVQSQLILGLVYFVVIAPFALVVRFFSDPMRLHGSPSWDGLSRESPSRLDLNGLKQQF